MDAGFLHWVITHTLKALDQIGSFFNLDKFYLFNPDVLPASKLSVTSGCFSSKVHTTIAGKKWETQNPVPSFCRQNSEKYKNYFEGSTFLKIWNSSKIFRKLLVRPQKRTSLNFGKKFEEEKNPVKCDKILQKIWKNTTQKYGSRRQNHFFQLCLELRANLWICSPWFQFNFSTFPGLLRREMFEDWL